MSYCSQGNMLVYINYRINNEIWFKIQESGIFIEIELYVGNRTPGFFAEGL